MSLKVNGLTLAKHYSNANKRSIWIKRLMRNLKILLKFDNFSISESSLIPNENNAVTIEYVGSADLYEAQIRKLENALDLRFDVFGKATYNKLNLSLNTPFANFLPDEEPELMEVVPAERFVHA